MAVTLSRSEAPGNGGLELVVIPEINAPRPIKFGAHRETGTSVPLVRRRAGSNGTMPSSRQIGNYLSRATVVVPSCLWLRASPRSGLFHIDTKSRN
jgi:hypothetical protein